jgi:hypothetical protein
MSKLSDFFRGVDGAASGAPVNTVATLNLPEDVNLYVDPDGGEWLRNGHFITSSFASYPNALTSSNITNFNIFAEKEINTNNDADRGQSHFTLKPDGSVLYIQGTVGIDDSGISIYNLSTSWDISTSTFVTGSPIGEAFSDGASAGLFFDNTGTFLFQNDVDNDFIKYTLSSAYNLESFTSASLVIPSGNITTNGFSQNTKISSDGLHIYAVSITDSLSRMELDAPYATTAVVDNDEIMSVVDTLVPSYFNNDTGNVGILDFSINTDGTKLILAVSSDVYTNDTMFLYCQLSTAHDLKTVSVIKYQHIPNFKVNKMHFNYSLTNGIVSATTTKNVQTNGRKYFSVSIDDSIGISKSVNPNLFLKIK